MNKDTEIKKLLENCFLNIDEILKIPENIELIKEVFGNIFFNSLSVLNLKSITSNNIFNYIYKDEYDSQIKTNKILLNFKLIKGLDFKSVFQNDTIKILNIEENKYYSINELKEAINIEFIVNCNNVSFKSKFNFIENED